MMLEVSRRMHRVSGGERILPVSLGDAKAGFVEIFPVCKWLVVDFTSTR